MVVTQTEVLELLRIAQAVEIQMEDLPATGVV